MMHEGALTSFALNTLYTYIAPTRLMNSN